MSHADETYEHPIEHHNPDEGFDRTEPAAVPIFAFTAGSIIILVLVIVAIQNYFYSTYQQAVHDKVLVAPSSQLIDVRNRDAWNMSHYMYGDLDPKSGRVRIPVDRAMDLFAQEAGSGKLFYPAKATAPKADDATSANPNPAPAK